MRKLPPAHGPGDADWAFSGRDGRSHLPCGSRALSSQIKNRGAEVFHQLHDAVRAEGIMSFIEEGVDEYQTELSQFIHEDEREGMMRILGRNDFVVVTALSHSLNEENLMPPQTVRFLCHSPYHFPLFPPRAGGHHFFIALLTPCACALTRVSLSTFLLLLTTRYCFPTLPVCLPCPSLPPLPPFHLSILSLPNPVSL